MNQIQKIPTTEKKTNLLFLAFLYLDYTPSLLATYNEWQPVPELGQQGYTFEGGVIYYNFYFRRATTHYMQNIVVRVLKYSASYRLFQRIYFCQSQLTIASISDNTDLTFSFMLHSFD